MLSLLQINLIRSQLSVLSSFNTTATLSRSKQLLVHELMDHVKANAFKGFAMISNISLRFHFQKSFKTSLPLLPVLVKASSYPYFPKTRYFGSFEKYIFFQNRNLQCLGVKVLYITFTYGVLKIFYSLSQGFIRQVFSLGGNKKKEEKNGPEDVIIAQEEKRKDALEKLSIKYPFLKGLKRLIERLKRLIKALKHLYRKIWVFLFGRWLKMSYWNYIQIFERLVYFLGALCLIRLTFFAVGVDLNNLFQYLLTGKKEYWELFLESYSDSMPTPWDIMQMVRDAYLARLDQLVPGSTELMYFILQNTDIYRHITDINSLYIKLEHLVEAEIALSTYAIKTAIQSGEELVFLTPEKEFLIEQASRKAGLMSISNWVEVLKTSGYISNQTYLISKLNSLKKLLFYFLGLKAARALSMLQKKNIPIQDKNIPK